MNKLRPKKSLGQNFLIDDFVIDQIIAGFDIVAYDNVLEIGPGTGALTNRLAKLNNINLFCVELDKNLAQKLTTEFVEICVIEQDFLKFDFNEVRQKNLKVVGNLPYYIASQIIVHCINNIDFIKDMNFMVQAEMADRLCAQPGDAEYSRLSVKAQIFCQVEKWLKINPDAFFPQPKVKSAMISLKPLINIPVINMQALDSILKAAFSARRKKLTNSLAAYFSKEKLLSLGVDYNLRADAVKVEEYILLSNNLTTS
jgi:16S rRNA (adenine1518-N6/adenine1519-N6)-dimethyltransferase